MSASLYDTFGNEISYDLRRGILTAYIEDATIDFPLPQASAELLERFSDPINTMNQQHLDMIKSKLEKIGLKKANSKALKYSSELVPAGKGMLKILLNLPFSFSDPVPG